MSDFSSFLGNLFGGNNQTAQLLGLMQAKTSAANDLAEQAAKQAREQAAAAMAPAIDSEAARQKSEQRMRRLIASRTPDEIMNTGNAPVATKMLMGT